MSSPVVSCRDTDQMKFRLIVGILFFVVSLPSSGQTRITTIKDIYKNRSIQPDGVVPLINPVNNQFALCLFQGKTINGYLFDKNYRLLNSFKSEDKQKSYKQIFGKTILNDNDYVIFITNNRRKKFASVQFSFEGQDVLFTELALDLGNEKIIQTADYNNKFHVFTIVPKTSIINVYRFDDNTSYIKFPIDFSGQVFLDGKQREVDLYDLVTIPSGMYGLSRSVNLVKIDPSNPTSLEMACNPTKFYSQKNRVFISFDQNETMTQLVDINLKTMAGKFRLIKKPLEFEDYKDKNGNSFLNGDVLYQIVTTRELIHLRAINHETYAIIGEYSAHVEEPIEFKNTSIVQTGGTFDNFREFESTDKLLRKIRQGKTGISVFASNDIHRITYGGVIETKSSPLMMPGFGIPIASLGAITLFINPAFYAFASYTSTKALMIEGIFNDKFVHQPGEIEPNIFDRIQKFEEDENVSQSGKTLFRIDNSYILGSYSGFDREYSLWAFEK